MKNLILHHLAIFLPIILLSWSWSSVQPEIALLLLFFYAIVYRTGIDGYRLYLKGLISKKDIWKVSYNGMRITYFKQLYLQK